MGFALLGHSGDSLAGDFAPAPPTRFAGRSLSTGARRRLGVSIGSRLALPRNVLGEPAHADRTTLLGFSHRPDPARASDAPPGLCVHLVSRRTLPPTVRHALGDEPRSTGAARDMTEVPSWYVTFLLLKTAYLRILEGLWRIYGGIRLSSSFILGD